MGSVEATTSTSIYCYSDDIGSCLCDDACCCCMLLLHSLSHIHLHITLAWIDKFLSWPGLANFYVGLDWQIFTLAWIGNFYDGSFAPYFYVGSFAPYFYVGCSAPKWYHMHVHR